MEYLWGMDHIKGIEEEVREKFRNEGSGHDWWHIHRVRNNAMMIAAEEGGELEVIELAALLHDIADHKFFNGDLSKGPEVAGQVMKKWKVSAGVNQKVCEIISQVSFKGAGVPTPVDTLEAAIVQDADRLDAIGAVGIARAFAFGGHHDRLLYDPENKPTLHNDFESYRTDKGGTINHFYEKLLLLKDRMNTPTAKRIAQKRHAYMEEYLKQFYAEWDGKA